MKWLVTEKKNHAVFNTEKNDDINQLTVKIMLEKLNAKYNSSLSLEQSELLREYVFSNLNSNYKNLRLTLENIRNDALKELEMFVGISKNAVLQQKLSHVIESIGNVDLTNINDHTIAKFLTITKLRSELLEKAGA